MTKSLKALFSDLINAIFIPIASACAFAAALYYLFMR